MQTFAILLAPAGDMTAILLMKFTRTIRPNKAVNPDRPSLLLPSNKLLLAFVILKVHKKSLAN